MCKGTAACEWQVLCETSLARDARNLLSPQIQGFSRHHCISVLPYHNTVGSLEERNDQGKGLVSCSNYSVPGWSLHRTTMKELSDSSSERASAWQIGIVIEALINWLSSLRAWGLVPD